MIDAEEVNRSEHEAEWEAARTMSGRHQVLLVVVECDVRAYLSGRDYRYYICLVERIPHKGA